MNGVAAPLYYISPTQLNVQIPYETSTSGQVTVVVSDNGQTTSAAIQMAAAAPGIYPDSTGGLVPTSTASAGQTLTMYVNGAGALKPAVATGSTPSSGTDAGTHWQDARDGCRRYSEHDVYRSSQLVGGSPADQLHGTQRTRDRNRTVGRQRGRSGEPARGPDTEPLSKKYAARTVRARCKRTQKI